MLVLLGSIMQSGVAETILCINICTCLNQGLSNLCLTIDC